VANNAAWRRAWEPRILSILRIMVGLLYMEHGLNKLFDFPPTPTHVAYHLFSLAPGLAGLLELFGGLLMALGLFTRPAAFILSGEMAAAYFIADVPRGFFPLLNRGETVILYCFIFFYFFVAGGGAWSLDRLRTPQAARFSPRTGS
jgi:putative oxidoreductase